MKIAYLIIANDLTGALDTTVAFATRGLKSKVTPSPDLIAYPGSADVIGFNAQTRTLLPEQAADAIATVTQRFVDLGFTNLYKKIDSTLRGNVGSETVAMMKSGQFDLAIVCPAFPVMGRTVENGFLDVLGLPQFDSKGIQVNLPLLLEEQTENPVGHISLDYIDAGVDIFVSRLSRVFDENTRIIACDAKTDSHLNTIVEATENSAHRVLLVGSGGLASAVANRIAPVALPIGESSFHPVSRPILIVCGSLNEVSQRQVAQLGYTVSATMLGMGISSKSEAAMVDAGSSEIARGRDLVLSWNDPSLIANSIDSAQTALDHVSQLATIASGIVKNSKPSALVIVGGETAYLTLQMLGTDSIEVQGEAMSGVPVGVIRGGAASGITLATKAGGFGGDQALAELRMILHGKTPA